MLSAIVHRPPGELWQRLRAHEKNREADVGAQMQNSNTIYPEHIGTIYVYIYIYISVSLREAPKRKSPQKKDWFAPVENRLY